MLCRLTEKQLSNLEMQRHTSQIMAKDVVAFIEVALINARIVLLEVALSRLALFARLGLGEQHLVNAWQYTTVGNGHST